MKDSSETFDIPEDSVFLYAGIKPGEGFLSLWFFVETDRILERRSFATVGTGNKIDPEISPDNYLATLLMNSGLVWHIFEITQNAREKLKPERFKAVIKLYPDGDIAEYEYPKA
tara:strand:- start:737 stop:1078 length:342 start_codon:yes stop_codon:yes gene_type:complete